MQNSLRLGAQRDDKWKVVLLCGLAGVLSAGLAVVTFQLGFSGTFSIVTAFPFAVMILLSVSVASNQGWLSFPLGRRTNRDWTTALLFAVSCPIGLFLATAISFVLTPAEFLDFDLHMEESLSPLELARYKAAWPVGGLFGAFVAILFCAIAVRVLLGKWPKHYWSWALCASLLTSVSLAFLVPLESERMFLAIWYSLLGTVIGYWILETSAKTVEA